MVDPDRGLRRDLHAPARHHRGERRAARDQTVAALLLRRSPVGRRRVRPDPRRLPPHRRSRRRHVRPPRGLRDRARDLLAGIADVRRVHLGAHAQPLARGPGHRWGDHVRDVTRPHRAGLLGEGARDGLRGLRGGRRRCGGDRAVDRRCDHQRDRVAVDLLRQPADRCRRDRDHARRGRELEGPHRAADRLGRLRHLLRFAVPARLRARPGQRQGMGQPAHRGVADRSRGADGGISARRVARTRPDARPRALQAARHVRGVPHLVHPLGVDLRDVPLPHPLHARSPRLQPVRHGAPLPADHDARLHRRAHRRQAHRPRQRARTCSVSG